MDGTQLRISVVSHRARIETVVYFQKRLRVMKVYTWAFIKLS
ncbi:hypothetical protein ALT785_250076 [Alteromonas infernus]